MAKFMCDFETTTKEDDCRVWAACAIDVETGEIAHLSNNIDEFMEWISKESRKCYFHNLRFDGEFILPWLFNHGFRHIGNEDKAIPEGCFQTVISDMGEFYKITICFKRKGKKLVRVEILDSLKKIPDKVKNIARDYGLEMAKGEIDYSLERPAGWEITDEEKDYIVKDCQIVQQALKMQLDEGMKKLTIASDALAYYKEILGRRWDYWFPVLPVVVDDDIRKAYRGGFTWVNPKYQNKVIKEKGIVLDVNSLYPWAMYYNPLPYGYPVYFEGEPKPDDLYPLFVVKLRCAFKIKPDHIPMIQIKKGMFKPTEYLEESKIFINGHWERIEVELTLTSVDLRLFLDHYDVENMVYISGFKFKAQEGMFTEYIDHWMHIKATSPKGSFQRARSKLYLNSLYGKFASSPERMQKTPYIAPDGVVRYYTYNEPMRDKNGDLMFDENGSLLYQLDGEGHRIPIAPDLMDPVYTPVGAFITAYARDKTIRAAQAVYDRFIYADTDSLHLIGEDLPEGLEIHPTDLGAWDHEGTFTQAKYLRAKTYIETIGGYIKVTCAGMPDNVKELVTYDNFKVGSRFPGKLLPKRVKGGIVLKAVDFTIQI